MDYRFIKRNVKLHEYLIYKYVLNIGFKFVPNIFEYDKINEILTTLKINNLSISDIYGEEFENVPKIYIKQIKNIIKQLFEKNIIYPDITGYNFIIDKLDKVWIVDFGDCFYYDNKSTEYIDSNEHIIFVKQFINNPDKWNPYFA
jgi:tRNA A-37 threonylcarbamoyl transferase component Bud32